MSKILLTVSNLDEHITPADQPPEWYVIERDHKQRLLDFYNVSLVSLTVEDLEVLQQLYNGETGSIHFIDCNECGADLCIAEPHSWTGFQGSICSNQDDFIDKCCCKTIVGEG